jgi:hypothetical protein
MSHERVSVPAEVMVQVLPDEEVVALNLATEEYYGLDPIGARFWTALVETNEVSAAREQLRAEFDVDPQRLRDDLDRFVADLVARGLLVAEPA